jgi:hypothetical protein
MQHQPISVSIPSEACSFCKGSLSPGAAVWRTGHPHHVTCVIRLLTAGKQPPAGRTLPRGLLPAGKDLHDRRTDLYKTNGTTAEVGRHA